LARRLKLEIALSTGFHGGMRVLSRMAVFGLVCQTGLAVDLICHNGKIVAVDNRFSIAQAMAVTNGSIAAVGSNDDILKLKTARTRVVDLQGRMVIPGLMDSHTHPTGASLTEFDHEIPVFETIADVLAYVRKRAEVLRPGEWIELQQVFITRLREQRYPTRAELDAAAPAHPVLFRTGPDASLNTLALKRSGIDRDFKVTDGGAGFVEKDPVSGEPTGILRNCTRFVPVKSPLRKPTEKEKRERLKALFRDYNSVGITTICDRDASAAGLELYKSLGQSGELTVRVNLSVDVPYLGAMTTIKERIRQIAAEPLFKQRNDWLRIVGVKTFLDGGMLTGSAYMRQPWGVSAMYGITDADYRGVLFIPKDRLREMVRATVENGLQFTAHSVGDGAVHTLLEVYEELSRELPLRATRPCITHANFQSAQAVQMAARLGVTFDIQPAWLYLDTRTLVRQFGYERLAHFQPLKSLFDAGVVAGGGSDHMQKIGSLRSNNPYNPFLGMQTALTRRARWYEDVLHPEQRISREQALRFYTINNAFLLFQEERTGSLEVGKLADLVVLDRDILKCPEEELGATRVVATYVAGKAVYDAGEGVGN
jgi:predicted amidohydrolase YtcJ